MTENEAIKNHIEECEERIGRILDYIESSEDANTKFCERNVEVLKSVVIALEEIQQYRAIGTVEEIKQFFNENRKAGYKHGYSDGYAKAIDEFAERIKKEASDCGWNCSNIHEGRCKFLSCDKCESLFLKEIDEIAEQMKGGE